MLIHQLCLLAICRAPTCDLQRLLETKNRARKDNIPGHNSSFRSRAASAIVPARKWMVDMVRDSAPWRGRILAGGMGLAALVGCAAPRPLESQLRAPIELIKPQPRHYVVEPGDTLYSIARLHKTSVSEIERLNPTVDARRLVVGTPLWVPASKPAFRHVESKASFPPMDQRRQ